MSRRFTYLFVGAFLALGLALVMGLVAISPGSAVAQTVSCDTSHSVNGAASPPYGTVGTTIVFTATGFTGGEAVSFWFTAPNGAVVGTAQPIPGGVNPNGTIGPLPFPITQAFLSVGEGRWAITFEGASSHHQAVIYFCVFTSADATAIAQPTAAPTSTSAPPTSTTAAATATTAATEVPTSAPTEVATSVPTEVATAAATSTTAVLPTSTTEVLPTSTTAAPAVPPTEAPTSTVAVLPLPTSAVPGMPTTGNAGVTLPAALALLGLALSVLAAGWLLRSKSRPIR